MLGNGRLPFFLLQNSNKRPAVFCLILTTLNFFVPNFSDVDSEFICFTRCHKFVEIAAGSRPCSKGFFQVLRSFSLHKNQHSKLQFDRDFEGHGFVSRVTVMCYPR